MATQPASIEALLGVPVGKQASRLALAYSIEDGLPVTALDRLADTVAPNDARFKFRLIPKATLERRRKSPSKRLTSEGNYHIYECGGMRLCSTASMRLERAFILY